MAHGIVARTGGHTTTGLRTWAPSGNAGAAEHNLLMTIAARTAEAAALLAFLDAQRECVLAIVGGLDEDLLMTPALPSGWTPLGLIEHLGHAERHWFQEVALRSAAPLPWPGNPPGTRRTRTRRTRPAARRTSCSPSTGTRSAGTGLGPR
jgi:hypothetical protein